MEVEALFQIQIQTQIQICYGGSGGSDYYGGGSPTCSVEDGSLCVFPFVSGGYEHTQVTMKYEYTQVLMTKDVNES